VCRVASCHGLCACCMTVLCSGDSSAVSGDGPSVLAGAGASSVVSGSTASAPVDVGSRLYKAAQDLVKKKQELVWTLLLLCRLTPTRTCAHAHTRTRSCTVLQCASGFCLLHSLKDATFRAC
jgi:hypothetical protein